MSRSRQLAAIMFTDIKGYTALMQRDEARAIKARNKHRKVFNSTTEKYKGQIFQYYGDGTLSIFNSAIDAVQCGIEMQLGFQEDPAIPVRIGIHTGDIFFDEEEIIGDSVNVASRIESLAVPGSVFISGKVYDEIKNQTSIKATWLKSVQLKNVRRPIEVYAIANEGLVVPQAEEVKGKTEPAPDQKKQTTSSSTRTTPVLTTKLFAPPARPGALQRTRLIDRLERGLHGRLTLIAAPAGFGKTTLVSEWITTNDRPVAWLSLDAGDSDPKQFLSYFIAALQTIDQSIGEKVLSMLQSAQPASISSFLPLLINDLTAIHKAFVLVLDDYHLVDNSAVDEALAFLLDHQPPPMHLIMTTREDPQLPLSRLRVRGQLTEIRAKDLRFTPSEAADFLDRVMGLKLEKKDINALEERTEGWIAGLQMAALSMQSRTDTQGFIQAFTGSHHFILDYLAEEVLQQQAEEIRQFLKKTAILDRMCGSLCDAVTGRKDGKKMLETLNRANLFVIPLDDRREWYRYHHLFAEVLRAHSEDQQGESPTVLHRRASEWFEANGFRPEAIRHALASEDMEWTARLVELAWPEMDRSFQTDAWLDWARQLPEAIVQNRPVILAGMGWALLSKGEMEAGEPFLLEAEKWLDVNLKPEASAKHPPAQRVVVDEEQFQYLPGSLATAYAYFAQALGQMPDAIKYSKQALQLLPKDDPLHRGPAAALLGLSYWAEGKLSKAHQAISDAMESFRKIGRIAFAISGSYGLADICWVQGRLHAAVNTYERSLRLVEEQGDAIVSGTADLYLGLSDLCRERNQLEKALQYLNKSKALEHAALPDWPYRSCLVEAHLKESQGELGAALELVDEAERLFYRTPVPVVRPIGAQRARLWIKKGNLREALIWVQEEGLSSDDEINYSQEYKHITLAKVLIAQFIQQKEEQALRQALYLLDRLQKAAETGQRNGSLIDILITQALAHQANNDIPNAIHSLTQALEPAKPEGYFRTFLDEGPPMVELLTIAAQQNILPHYTHQLIAASKGEEPTPPRSNPYFSLPPTQTLVEPLSSRELEILQLIAQGLSNKQISERLFLALSTVKGHNRNIFEKLEVKRRTEAVAKAREIGILQKA